MKEGPESLTPSSPAQSTLLGRGAPTTSGYEKQWGFQPSGGMEGCGKPTQSLKGPSEALTLGTGGGMVTLGALETGDREGTELCNFQMRTGGTVLIFPVWGSSPEQLAGRRHLSCIESTPTGQI